MQPTKIENCPKFAFTCPKTWQSLDLTEDEKVRFCDTCQQNVYWCDNLDLARAQTQLGRCIAIAIDDSSQVIDPTEITYVGRMRMPQE